MCQGAISLENPKAAENAAACGLSLKRMSCKCLGTDGISWLEKDEEVSVTGKQSVDVEVGGYVYGCSQGAGILLGCVC